MGQQQLLLLVLGVIIVGIAVVAGIGMFNAAAEESVKDELAAQLMAIGANAQQWYKKPVSMDGGGGTFAGYEIPERMSYTESAGSAADPADPASTITAAYIAGTGTTSVLISVSPNEPAYAWDAEVLVTSIGMTVTIND